MKREVKLADDTYVASYKDENGSSIIISQNRPNGIVQVNKDEAFKLAYALLSLASEL